MVGLQGFDDLCMDLAYLFVGKSQFRKIKWHALSFDLMHGSIELWFWSSMWRTYE